MKRRGFLGSIAAAFGCLVASKIKDPIDSDLEHKLGYEESEDYYTNRDQPLPERQHTVANCSGTHVWFSG